MIVSGFIIQANVITIVNYDRHLFIQATGNTNRRSLSIIKVACFVKRKIMLAMSKEAVLNYLGLGGQRYRVYPFS
jgi:hypothetical protein